ncbi:uncharacterized protein LOC122570091 isoform X2 [Bombus pyrosoma]|uniref:uncharacterized protein LOC122570091 isoform X2 n=1 Tax=Bombus pyrosoma TaxID=396416 RepID=UPI001CB8CB27|nr:uncharacterized protein LOC122570091 isoform X2 [Bombus pyrosoma]
MSILKELLRHLEQTPATKLESENATLKMETVQRNTTGMMCIIEMDMHLDEQTKKLDREIHTMKGNLNAEQVMTHLKCMVTAPATCSLPGRFAKQFGKSWRNSDESLSPLIGSVQTTALATDQPDKPDTKVKTIACRWKVG